MQSLHLSLETFVVNPDFLFMDLKHELSQTKLTNCLETPIVTPHAPFARVLHECHSMHANFSNKMAEHFPFIIT